MDNDNNNIISATPEEIRAAHALAMRAAKVVERSHDGRPRTAELGDVDHLLAALIRIHPERDPARIK